MYTRVVLLLMRKKAMRWGSMGGVGKVGQAVHAIQRGEVTKIEWPCAEVNNRSWESQHTRDVHMCACAALLRERKRTVFRGSKGGTGRVGQRRAVQAVQGGMRSGWGR